MFKILYTEVGKCDQDTLHRSTVPSCLLVSASSLELGRHVFSHNVFSSSLELGRHVFSHNVFSSSLELGRHVFSHNFFSSLSLTDRNIETGGISWSFTSVLEDLDYADDIGLLSSRHKDIKEKVDRPYTRNDVTT